MQGVRSRSAWLLSGPPTGRGCLLLTAQYSRPHHELRQFSVRASSRKQRDEKPLSKAGLDEKRQNPQSGEMRNFRNAAPNSSSRILLFFIFPFISRTASASSPLQGTRQREGFPRGATWIYRILWLLGIGYAGHTYLLPSPLSSADHAVFTPPRFTPFSIVEKHDVSPTSVVLTVRPQTAVRPDIEPYEKSWNEGTWSVEFKQPQLQIARSYTPLPPISGASSPSDLRFLIRREKGGEVSNYLANLPLHATVEIRGPHAGIGLPMDTTDIVFLAGGTGIAPAMQVVYTMLEKRTETQKSKIHIVWANRKRADCVGGVSSSTKTRKNELFEATDHPPETVVRELQIMRQKYPDNLSIDYVVDEEGTFLDRKSISLITAKASRDMDISGSGTGSKLLFVSGPEGFVSFLAGPKKWEDGDEKQGNLGGILGQMNLKGWQVWKM
jgi:cytochrome-b5 reductase